MSDNVTFETDHYRWFIKLKRKDRQTTATVTGIPPARSVSAGATIPKQAFTLTDPDQDSLMKHVRNKVKQVDGPILRTDY